jgi:hypothetical protein
MIISSIVAKKVWAKPSSVLFEMGIVSRVVLAYSKWPILEELRAMRIFTEDDLSILLPAVGPSENSGIVGYVDMLVRYWRPREMHFEWSVC